MLVVISPLLAVIALVTVPLSVVITAKIGKRAQKGFVAQWKHVGALNGQIEEAFTGHALVKVFGRRRQIEARFARKNDELYDAELPRAVRVEHDHAGDQLRREPQLRRDRGGRRAARRVGRDAARQRAGVHPVLAAVHAERSASSRRSRTCCSRASRRPSACSSCSTRPISRPTATRRSCRSRCAARSGSTTSRSATSPTCR